MTVYTYRLLNTDGTDGALVEIDQPFAAPALTHHPETGQLVRRTIECAPNIGGRWSERASGNSMAVSKKNVAPARIWIAHPALSRSHKSATSNQPESLALRPDLGVRRGLLWPTKTRVLSGAARASARTLEGTWPDTSRVVGDQ